ncbi:D-threonate kinase [Vibrio cincinnatiensis]|uniref:D-threonate kinase n=1 Tax=Vibrio cincinnatiensis TaxID=675 RepID=UPI0012ACF5CA|nr:four-carbon acid sugar kinase family protein [Vibrio cincinnatiensis]
MKLIVVADDFTGANDTGVQFAKKNARTESVLVSGSPVSQRTDVIVINTESRALSSEAAKQRVMDCVEPYLKHSELPLVYKKIDSTFRGNVGAEIDAVFELTGARVAIVAGAIPGAGRITKQGLCYVNGVPLLDTEFASDPKTPIHSSRIQDIISGQSCHPVEELHLSLVREGSEVLQTRLAAIAAQQSSIVIIDAETDDDLAIIAEAALALPQTKILVGAAGLANALPKQSFMESDQPLPLLIVAGSMSEATLRQVEHAQQYMDVAVIDIAVEQFIQPTMRDRYLLGLTEQVAASLKENRHTILRTCQSRDTRHEVQALCDVYSITRNELGSVIADHIGQLMCRVIAAARIGGLFLTGGDIAIAVANALGAKGYRISEEVMPCIPSGTFIDSEIDDLPVITKAGGFGQINTMCRAIEFIEGMYNES